jgi:hypothetical protein
MQIKNLPGAAAPRAVGHDLLGWASLVIATRENSRFGAFNVQFRDDLLKHAKNVSLCWSEILRYRANKPYDIELKAVADAAKWLRRNYKHLWS